MSITANMSRVGNFTSSEIYRLIDKKKPGTIGKTARTYILEKNIERQLGRSLSTESSARQLVWGKHCESIAFNLDKIGLEYSLCSQETLIHPTIRFWTGSPDIKKINTIGDFKAPYTLKSFCLFAQPVLDGLSGLAAINFIRENHEDGEKYYQQLVSNSCITESDFAELMVFCPYQSQLDMIRHEADGFPEKYFIWAAADCELPYIPDDGNYSNLYIIRFEVPQADKEFLTELVIEAGKHLIPWPLKTFPATYDAELKATIIHPEK